MKMYLEIVGMEAAIRIAKEVVIKRSPEVSDDEAITELRNRLQDEQKSERNIKEEAIAENFRLRELLIKYIRLVTLVTGTDHVEETHANNGFTTEDIEWLERFSMWSRGERDLPPPPK